MSDFQGSFREIVAAVQAGARWFYAIAGVIWLGALVFAGYRIYQIFTQVLVPAEVLESGLHPYYERSSDRDTDGFTEESVSLRYDREAKVRYQVNGKVITAGIRQSGSGFRWIEELVLREWKPGTRIRVRIDPAEPEKPQPALGLRYSTFQFSLVMALGGGCFAGFGYAMVRAMEFFVRKMEAHMPAVLGH